MTLLSKILGRSGRPFDGPLCRASVPRHPGAVSYFATKTVRGEEVPNLRRPLRWVTEDREAGLGHFEEA